MKTLPIKTERLILREVEYSDAHNMFLLDSNPEVHNYLGKRMIASEEEGKDIVQHIKNQYIENGIGRWAAVEKSSGRFIGWSGLKLNNDIEMNGYTNFYDIGYRLMPEFWGKGYATESSIASLEYGFNVLQLDTIYGITHFENEASHKVLLKIGLTLIDTFRHESEDFLLRWYEIKRENYG